MTHVEELRREMQAAAERMRSLQPGRGSEAGHAFTIARRAWERSRETWVKAVRESVQAANRDAK